MQEMELRKLEKELWDCIIVGAGPAGSYAGYLLAKKGARVLIIEKSKYPGEKKACGGCLSIFFINKLNINEIIEQVLYEAEIYFRDRQYKYKSKTPMGIMVRRSIFDSYIAKKAENAGAHLLCSFYAYDVSEKASAVFCHSSYGNEKAVFTGKCILLADGTKTLGIKLGIGFDMKTQDFIPAIKADLKIDNPSHAMKFFIDAKTLNIGYYWIFSKKTLYNIGVGGRSKYNNLPLNSLLKIFINIHFRNNSSQNFKIKGGMIPLETAKKFASRNVVVIGDAAGFVNPITGGGIHYALKSAEIAAQAIIKNLQRGKPINLKCCNYLFRMNYYFIWLKIMRIFLTLIYQFGNYKATAFCYFLRFYFSVFFFAGDIAYFIAKIRSGFKKIFSKK